MISGIRLGDIESFVSCYIQVAGDQDKSQETPTGTRFITLSRQTGAGGITISEALIRLINLHKPPPACPWVLFDRTLVEAVLGNHSLPSRIEKYMPENKLSEIQDVLEDIFGIHPPQISLVHKTSETILRLAEMGHCVIVGRGAPVVTRRLKGGFHVRLVGSLERRIKHAGEYYKLTPSEAAARVHQEDEGRKKYLKSYFSRDIDDPLLYDLVINTDRLRYEEAARLIYQAAFSPR